MLRAKVRNVTPAFFHALRAMIASTWPETSATEVSIRLADGREVKLPMPHIIPEVVAVPPLNGSERDVLAFLRLVGVPMNAKEARDGMERLGTIYGQSTVERALAKLAKLDIVYKLHGQGYAAVDEIADESPAMSA
jgi:hypothetical protein